MTDMTDSERPEIDTPAPIGYAMPGTLHGERSFRRRRVFAWIVLVCIVLFFVTVPILVNVGGPWEILEGWKRHREQARRQQLEQARYQACLNFTLPPRTIVYEEEPAQAQQLLKSGSGFGAISGWTLTSAGQPMPVGMRPAVEVAYFAPMPTPPCVFLHGLGPAGQQQLVMVSITVTRSGNFLVPPGRTITFHASAYDQQRSEVGRGAEVWEWVPAAGIFRVFAGQVDRADPSAFHISYENNGKPGSIRGWWDGSRVQLVEEH